MTTDTRIQVHKLLEGQQFTAARGLTIDTGQIRSIHIENPSSSEKTIVFYTQELKASAGASGTYYRNPDTSGGTQGGSANDLIGDEKSSIANVTYDATLSNADSTTTFPLSDANGPTESGLTDRGPIAVKPGNSMGVEVTSSADGNGVLMLLVFYETSRGN